MKAEHNQEPHLDDYFSALKQQLPDSGFTKRVMNQIPQREPLISKRGLFFAVIGLVLSLFVALGTQLVPTAPYVPDHFTLVFYLVVSVGAVLVIVQALDPELEVM